MITLSCQHMVPAAMDSSHARILFDSCADEVSIPAAPSEPFTDPLCLSKWSKASAADL